MSPQVGGIDPTEVKAVFLAELGRGTELERYLARFWERAKTVEVRRQRPFETWVGKVPAFHLDRT